jgi:hypothetical protein
VAHCQTASACLLQLTCVAPAMLPIQNQRIRTIKIQTFHCSPLYNNIPNNRLLQGLAADFFSRDWTPVDLNNTDNVVVWLPVLDAKSTKTPKPLTQERLRY